MNQFQLAIFWLCVGFDWLQRFEKSSRVVVVNAEWHFWFNYILGKCIITIEILAVYCIWKSASYKIMMITYSFLYYIELQAIRLIIHCNITCISRFLAKYVTRFVINARISLMLNEVTFRFYDICFLQQDFITSVYNVFERCHQIAFKTVCYRWYVCITGSLEEKRKIKLY